MLTDQSPYLFKWSFKRVDLFDWSWLKSIDEAAEHDSVLQVRGKVNLVLDVPQLLPCDLLYPCHTFLCSLRAEFCLSLAIKEEWTGFLHDTEIALFGIGWWRFYPDMARTTRTSLDKAVGWVIVITHITSYWRHHHSQSMNLFIVEQPEIVQNYSDWVEIECSWNYVARRFVSNQVNTISDHKVAAIFLASSNLTIKT